MAVCLHYFSPEIDSERQNISINKSIVSKKKRYDDDILRTQHYDKLVKKIDEKQEHRRLQFNLLI